MGPIFHEKIPYYGFWFSKFCRVLYGKFWKIAKNGYYFSVTNGYFFLEKLPLNMGMVHELSVAHPRPIQIWELSPRDKMYQFYLNRGVFYVIQQIKRVSWVINWKSCSCCSFCVLALSFQSTCCATKFTSQDTQVHCGPGGGTTSGRWYGDVPRSWPSFFQASRYSLAN